MTKEELSIGDSQPEIDGEEDQGNVGGWGAETIEGGAVTTGETFVAGLTLEPLDAICAALTVPDQRMKRWVGVAEVVAFGTRTGVPGGADGLGLTTCALAFTPGQDAGFATVAEERGGMWATADRAIVGRAWLERAWRFALG